MKFAEAKIGLKCFKFQVMQIRMTYANEDEHLQDKMSLNVTHFKEYSIQAGKKFLLL